MSLLRLLRRRRRLTWLTPPDLKQESAHAFEDLEEVADFKEESTHAFVDLEERDSADSVADFEEESADAVLVDFER